MNDFSIILSSQTVYLDIEPFHDKQEMFQILASWYKSTGIIRNEQRYIDALYQREELGSTYMGNLIALPHAKSETVNRPAVLFCRLKEPFRYQSHGESGMVKYIFMLAISARQSGYDYMRMLAHLAGLLANDEFLKILETAKSCQQIVNKAMQLDWEEEESK
ncbi:PTS sugar transporter subunit IIA [[Clostridium] innocuum]|nr:PTS sugar transporter subunit IIA [[Clostridium] innocuum]